MQQDQSVSQMTEEVLVRQTKALAERSGLSLEDARLAVSDTEAGRQLKGLASGEHRHEKARAWQAGVFWDRAEERLMHHFASEALSRFAAEDDYSWLESYLERLEGKEERAHYYALVECSSSQTWVRFPPPQARGAQHMQSTSAVSNPRPCPPHGPYLIEAVGGGLYAARCLACGLMGPKRKDGLEAKLALDQRRHQDR